MFLYNTCDHIKTNILIPFFIMGLNMGHNVLLFICVQRYHSFVRKISPKFYISIDFQLFLKKANGIIEKKSNSSYKLQVLYALQ